jgi:hypothetical protein
MKIEKVSIDSIKVYPNNAKIHTAEQIEEIKKSIQEFETMIQLLLMKKVL